MTRAWVAALLAIVLSGGLIVRGHQAGAAQPSPGAQLETAIKKEVVDGDLQTALEMYRKLSQSGDRAVAAKALLRMGQCYEKLGAADARQSYEQVVSRFADQAEAVAQARARLAALGMTRPASAVSVTKISDSEALTISEDGRFVAEQEWGEMGTPGTRRPVLSILDRVTGESRMLRKQSDGWVERGGAFSPDGRSLAYAWWPGANWLELQVLSLDRFGEPRVVFRCNEKLSWLVPFDWTSDGKSILVLAVAAKQETTAIALIDAADGRLRELKKFQGSWSVSHPAMSPDGAYVVYSRASRPGTMQHDVMVLSVADLQERPLVESAADDSNPLWTADGKSVLFRSDRRGPADLWLQSVARGAAVGEPQMVRGEVGPVSLLGLSASGALAYSSRTRSLYAYTAPLDPVSGKAGKPVRVSDRAIAPGTPFWSPDGRTLAVLRPAAVALLSPEEGTEREVPLGLGSPVMSGWFPDGRSLLITGTDGEGHEVFLRQYVDQVRAERLPRMGRWWKRLAIAPDGKATFAGLGQWIGRFDIASGERKEIATAASNVASQAVAPDGSRVAFIEVTADAKTTVLWTVEANGGTPKRIASWSPVAPGTGFAWTPDGRFILVVEYNEATKKHGVRRVSLADGTWTSIGVSFTGTPDGLSISPDGRRLAFNDGVTAVESWVLENFLPKTTPKLPPPQTVVRKNR